MDEVSTLHLQPSIRQVHPYRLSESTAVHLEPYSGTMCHSPQSYLVSSSGTTSCFQLFGEGCVGGGGGAAAPPSPSASDQMASSPAAVANVLTPSMAAEADSVQRCGAAADNIFQFPPPPPMSVAGKEAPLTSPWEAMVTTTSVLPQQQHSPMAISPSFSTLNTPRGSIASNRSQQSSHSPMGMMVDGATMGSGQQNVQQAYHLGRTF